MVSTGQIIGIAFGIIMVLLTWISHLKNRIRGINAIVFYFLWIGWISGILLFYNIKSFAKSISIEVFDLFAYIAIIILFVFIFSMSMTLKQNQKKIEEIVENIAMRESKRK